MFQEIGSNFWVNKNEKLDYYNGNLTLDFLEFNFADKAFLSTGRSAISFVLENINTPHNERIALLPPFTCHTVIEPFIEANYEVYYYQINNDLTCDIEKIDEDIEKYNPSVVLMHSYFGFDTLSSIKHITDTFKNKGIIVIEDMTQSVYSNFKHLEADYYICSLRKWTALPDGAFAISKEVPFRFKPEQEHESLLESKLEAFHLKWLYINKKKEIKDKFLGAFRDAEQILNSQEQIYKMGTVSQKIQQSQDLSILRNRRRENFSILLKGLLKSEVVKPLFRELPDNVTPLYFPVMVNSREKVQKYLAGENIYAPIIWPKPNYCNNHIHNNVEDIYKKILAIPCDQRYGNQDMNRIIDTIKRFDSYSRREGVYK